MGRYSVRRRKSTHNKKTTNNLKSKAKEKNVGKKAIYHPMINYEYAKVGAVDEDMRTNRKTAMKFSFWNNANRNEANHKFDCFLKCRRCIHVQTNGVQCKRNVCMGRPYCWQHMKDIRIAKSKIPQAGNGIFAKLSKEKRQMQEHHDIVFSKGDIIGHYIGELLDARKLDERYGESTAPYALHLSNDMYVDCACDRSIVALANHAMDSKSKNAELEFYMNPQNGLASGVLRASKNIKDGDEILTDYIESNSENHNTELAYKLDDNTFHETKPRRVGKNQVGKLP